MNCDICGKELNYVYHYDKLNLCNSCYDYVSNLRNQTNDNKINNIDDNQLNTTMKAFYLQQEKFHNDNKSTLDELKDSIYNIEKYTRFFYVLAIISLILCVISFFVCVL